METVEILGLVLLSVLFIFSAIHHLSNHVPIVRYAVSVGQPFPYLAGWPVGVFLLALGVAIPFDLAWAYWAGAAFLAVAAFYFHRAKEDRTVLLKQIALIGALVALAAKAAA